MGKYTASYIREREAFVAKCIAGGLTEHWARTMCRHATTATRLAVAGCNGPEWADNPYIPADVFSKRMDRWQRSLDRADALCEGRIKRICERCGINVMLQGDPRGAVVKVRIPGVSGDDWGDPSWLCVPAPEF